MIPDSPVKSYLLITEAEDGGVQLFRSEDDGFWRAVTLIVKTEWTRDNRGGFPNIWLSRGKFVTGVCDLLPDDGFIFKADLDEIVDNLLEWHSDRAGTIPASERADVEAYAIQFDKAAAKIRKHPQQEKSK